MNMRVPKETVCVGIRVATCRATASQFKKIIETLKAADEEHRNLDGIWVERSPVLVQHALCFAMFRVFL